MKCTYTRSGSTLSDLETLTLMVLMQEETAIQDHSAFKSSMLSKKKYC